MIKICTACGTAYEEQDRIIEHCAICEDARQFVPASGQQWTTPDALRATHRNMWQQPEPGLLSLQTVPAFAIDQRAFLLQTAHGNVLWDCIAHLDDATCTLIQALGGIAAIAISHPHYYTTQREWAAAFNAPVWLHADDRQWIMSPGAHIRLWHGDSMALMPEVTLLRAGGHFAGGTVLHWARDEGVLLTGDILQVTPGADRVSFMWSYPNMLPLAAATVRDMMTRLKPLSYQRLYGAFAGREIIGNAQSRVRASAQRYLACLEDPHCCPPPLVE